MWFYTSTNYLYWVELGNNYGTCLGGTAGINICPRGYDVSYPHAFRYWADENGNGVQYAHYISDWSINSNNHVGYEIQRNPNNICQYFVYVQGILDGTSKVQYCPGGYSYGYEVDVGMEHNYGRYDPNFYSNTVSHEQLATWHDGAWHPWEYQYSYNNDEACTSQITVNGFNGTNYGSDTIWATNRPWTYG
jgi:hypothetical protein